MSTAARQMKGLRDRQRGFTLIETAIVVSVIGILTAISIPNYLRAADRARRGSCLANQRNLVLATTLYCADNGLQDGIVSSGTLHDEQYTSSEISHCPSNEAPGFEDYTVTVLDGTVIAVECLVRGEEHQLEF